MISRSQERLLHSITHTHVWTIGSPPVGDGTSRASPFMSLCQRRLHPCSAAFVVDEPNTEVVGQRDIIGNATWHSAGLDRSHTRKLLTTAVPFASLYSKRDDGAFAFGLLNRDHATEWLAAQVK